MARLVKYRDPQERIQRNVAIESQGCWTWQRYLSPDGYGHVRVGNRVRFAHRESYEVFVGPIPEGLTIDHLCRNRACCNPAHLEPVTMRENTLRSPITQASLRAAQTHCVNGHEFTPENTYPAGKAGRNRRCRTCQLAATRRSAIRRALRAANVPARAAA